MGPRNFLTSLGKNAIAELVQLQRLPQRPAQPHGAEGAAVLDANTTDLDLGSFKCAFVLEELRLDSLGPKEVTRKSRRLSHPTVTEPAEIRDGLLNDLRAPSHGAHECPVSSDSVLASDLLVPEIHGVPDPVSSLQQLILNPPVFPLHPLRDVEPQWRHKEPRLHGLHPT